MDVAQLITKIYSARGDLAQQEESTDIQEITHDLIKTFINENKKTDADPKPNIKSRVPKKFNASSMISTRASEDPTIIMEARKARLKQMKAQRTKQKENAMNTSNIIITEKQIEIPNIDLEIQQHRQRIKKSIQLKRESLIQKAKISERARVIDRITIANETKCFLKKDYSDKIKQIRERATFFYTKSYWMIWATSCHFETPVYKKAVTIDYNKTTSKAFTKWKHTFLHFSHIHKLDELETKLKRCNNNAAEAEKILERRSLSVSFTKWRAQFKASIEQKVIEKQRERRHDTLVSKIVQQHLERDIPKVIHEKTNIKPIKVNARLDSMMKRMAVQKKRQAEKVRQALCQAENEQEEKIKEEMEMERKKRHEHQLFLEKEKQKREQQKERELALQSIIDRKKYCETASTTFRLNHLKSTVFSHWSRIHSIREKQEHDAVDHYLNHLRRAAICGLHQNSDLNIKYRMKYAETFYQQNLLRTIILGWAYSLCDRMDAASGVAANHSLWIQKAAVQHWIFILNQKRKAKHMKALKHYQKSLLKKTFLAWPDGCFAIKDEERKSEIKKDLFIKALQLLDEIDID